MHGPGTVQAESADGAPMVILQNVPAGSELEQLGFYCCDEARQPVYSGMKGRVQLSWSRGSKNVELLEGVICLPEILVSCPTTRNWPTPHDAQQCPRRVPYCVVNMHRDQETHVYSGS